MSRMRVRYTIIQESMDTPAAPVRSTRDSLLDSELDCWTAMTAAADFVYSFKTYRQTCWTLIILMAALV